MRSRSSRIPAALLVFALLSGLAEPAGATARAQEKRRNIDTMASETLERLLSKSPKARELYGKAYGYAVFSNIKVSLVLTGGGGRGVAIHKVSGRRTYMRMGTGGVNVGLGGQKYQVVFLFQDSRSYRNFVDRGWQADASANAVAGPAGVNADATFTNGVAVFQLTEGGLMLQVDISGTKYWRSKRLNEG